MIKYFCTQINAGGTTFAYENPYSLRAGDEFRQSGFTYFVVSAIPNPTGNPVHVNLLVYKP